MFITLWAASEATDYTPLAPKPDVSSNSSPLDKLPKGSLLYGLVAFAWAVFAMIALGRPFNANGAICPIGGGLRSWTPLVQLVMCSLDAFIISQLAKIRRRDAEAGTEASNYLPKLCAVAVGCLFIPAIVTWIIEAMPLKYLDYRDLFFDSTLVAVTIVSTWLSLLVVPPTTVGLLIASVGLFGFEMPWPTSIWFTSPTWFSSTALANVPVALLAGFLYYLVPPGSNSPSYSNHAGLRRPIFVNYLRVVAVCIVCWMLTATLSSSPSLADSVDMLITNARLSAKDWQSRAGSSKTLEQAVKQYRLRYNTHPPPNFDKWYKFAMDKKSPIIDDFNQIYDDLLPFWGVKPAELRAQTAHLLGYAEVGTGGLRIRNHKSEQSPHIPGTHHWMTETWEKMIQPFIEWLPDMDIAFNLGDECQVSVPFEAMEALKQAGIKTHAEMNTKDTMSTAMTKHEWPSEWVEPIPGERVTPDFTNRGGYPVYNTFVAPSCPPSSNARSFRWWDLGTLCVPCTKPHSIMTKDGSLVSDVNLAMDLCHQPDAATLSGFINAPAVSVITPKLYPVFSQSRTGGFADILVPSPWNYNDKSVFNDETSVHWDKKENTMFWRGSSSDGFAHRGRWAGFMRARFVHQAYEQAAAQLAKGGRDKPALNINVSFVGGVPKCAADRSDCTDELRNFEHWATPALAKVNGELQYGKDNRLPAESPFDEHWHYKHLMDLDGAAFSGRFLPFVESGSLPYRTALFRTWVDERLQEWHHYVPVDLRLGSGLWSVLDYFSGRGKYRDAGGDEKARAIAETGQAWARKALRHEDMEVYMFRLLLEWGRIVDDNRENLGFKI